MTDTSKPPYPANWKSISRGIRDRARGRCECTGECGLHQPLVSVKDLHRAARLGLAVKRRCIEQEGKPATYAKGKVMLTVHHLGHDPTNNHPRNLKAMCQRCHLRCDMPLHRRNLAVTRDAKTGQERLPGSDKRDPFKGRPFKTRSRMLKHRPEDP